MSARIALSVMAIIPAGMGLLVLLAAFAAYLTAAFLTLAGFCLAGLGCWIVYGEKTIEFAKQIWHGQPEQS